MFCRFCGTSTLPDSRFCSKCGKRLVAGRSRAGLIVRKSPLKTPYPYAAILFLSFLLWAAQPDRPAFDYTDVSLELELVGKSELRTSNLYRHHFSLIVENVGSAPLNDIPVEIRAYVEPDQMAQVESDFLGRRILIMRDGIQVPLIIILQDDVGVSDKRRYSIDGIVTSVPPFRITYEILTEDSNLVLSSFSEAVPTLNEESEEPLSEASVSSSLGNLF